MTLSVIGTVAQPFGRNLIIAGCALALAGCVGMNEDEDSVIGSHLAQPPAGTPPMKAAEVGDITIVGQEVAHAIMDLPAISGASVPPLVQFNGVTSILDQPIDTDPYTELLRDRLLLLTREKLRFVEHTLPPYVPGKKHKSSEEKQPVQNLTNPDYRILAELRGHAAAEFYRIQVEFVDVRTNEVLFNGLYHIRHEATEQPAPEQPAARSEEPQPMQTPESTVPDTAAPTTKTPYTGGNTAL